MLLYLEKGTCLNNKNGCIFSYILIGWLFFHETSCQHIIVIDTKDRLCVKHLNLKECHTLQNTQLTNILFLKTTQMLKPQSPLRHPFHWLYNEHLVSVVYLGGSVIGLHNLDKVYLYLYAKGDYVNGHWLYLSLGHKNAPSVDNGFFQSLWQESDYIIRQLISISVTREWLYQQTAYLYLCDKRVTISADSLSLSLWQESDYISRQFISISVTREWLYQQTVYPYLCDKRLTISADSLSWSLGQ